MMQQQQIVKDIAARNEIRGRAGMPLLNMPSEAEQLIELERRSFEAFSNANWDRIKAKIIRVQVAKNPEWRVPQSLLNGGLLFYKAIELKVRKVYDRMKRRGLVG